MWHRKYNKIGIRLHDPAAYNFNFAFLFLFLSHVLDTNTVWSDLKCFLWRYSSLNSTQRKQRTIVRVFTAIVVCVNGVLDSWFVCFVCVTFCLYRIIVWFACTVYLYCQNVCIYSCVLCLLIL